MPSKPVKRRRISKSSSSSPHETRVSEINSLVPVHGPNHVENISSHLKKSLHDVALVAIVPSHDQKEVNNFIVYLLESLQRNCYWINDVDERYLKFKCAMMVGAGPNLFQIQEMIYPNEKEDIKLEVEVKESKDHDKIAIAALLKINEWEITRILDFMRTRLDENKTLKEDLLKGKSMGVQFAVLKAIDDVQYRIMEVILVGDATKCEKVQKKKLI